MTNIYMLEFRGSESTKTQLFATEDGILSFDLDWNRDWLYWTNHTGHVQYTSLTRFKSAVLPTPVPGECLKSSLGLCRFVVVCSRTENAWLLKTADGFK